MFYTVGVVAWHEDGTASSKSWRIDPEDIPNFPELFGREADYESVLSKDAVEASGRIPQSGVFRE